MVVKIHDNGFTLVELLIVVSVTVTILGLGFASFNRFNRRERLKQVALTLKANLRFAQTKAISAEKPQEGCTTFVGMRIRFAIASYAVYHECSPEGLVGAGETTTLPQDITFATVPLDFTFQTLTQRIDSTEDQTLTLTNGSESYSIVVSSNGSVADSGFL